MTPFESDIGATQGRLVVDDAGDGIYAFVLGSAGVRSYDIAAGDHVDLVQTMDVTGDDLIRVDTLAIETPDDVPDGYAWYVAMLVDGEEVAIVYGWPGRERTPTDLAANVAHLVGEHQVGIRLGFTGT